MERPNNHILGMFLTPSGPLVTGVQFIAIILIISLNPNVTIARYMPLSFNVGSDTSSPASAVTTPAIGIASQYHAPPMPSFVASSAPV